MAQACPFLFPGELACPDVPGQAHSGRAETKTPVPMGLWTTLFSRRSEHQWGANWSFSYLRWNYWFRSNLNAAKPLICTPHQGRSRATDSSRSITRSNPDHTSTSRRDKTVAECRKAYKGR